MHLRPARPELFDMEHQKERRFSSGTKVGPCAILFVGDNQKERRSNSGTKVGPSAILFGRDYQKERGLKSGVKRLLNLLENNRWFMAGQVVLIVAVIIGWRIVTELGLDITPLQTPGIAKTGQSVAASRPVIEAQEKQITGLNERVAILTDSTNFRESPPIVTAEQGLISSIARKQVARLEPEQIIETLPLPAGEPKAGHAKLAQPSTSRTNSAAAAQSGADNAVPTVAGTAALRANHGLVAKGRPVGSASTGGPWVINLVSSSRKADADRFAEKARSIDIKTEQQVVTIKGHQYWRVQITGFATAKEAGSYAGTARAKLGLKDVWITRR
jgi:hypothetical protein